MAAGVVSALADENLNLVSPAAPTRETASIVSPAESSST
jgi:hypothetical protein